MRAIVEREAQLVATACTGTRHHTLLNAARPLGRLLGPHYNAVVASATLATIPGAAA